MKQGFSLVELLVVIILIIVIGAVIFAAVNPGEIKARGRDARRIADIESLSAVVESFRIDTGSLPDLADITRKSDTAVNGGSYEFLSNGQGWIGEDVSAYLPFLPIDPINSDQFVYRYRHDGNGYEIDARLEFLTQEMDSSKDGGNSNLRIERGTDLNLLGN